MAPVLWLCGCIYLAVNGWIVLILFLIDNLQLYDIFLTRCYLLKMESSMVTCEFCDSCSFFKEELQGNPRANHFLCNTLCNGDFITCARYKIAMSQGVVNVPGDLLPNLLTCL